MSTTEKATGFIAEFKKFIARGNVMDMAVGVIVGGAFKGIADSLTNDILMPLILLVTNGGAGLSAWSLNVGGSVLNVGLFFSSILTFLITALAVFCLVKGINSFHRKKEAAAPPPPAAPAPTREELLLTEIRDLLKEQAK